MNLTRAQFFTVSMVGTIFFGLMAGLAFDAGFYGSSLAFGGSAGVLLFAGFLRYVNGD